MSATALQCNCCEEPMGGPQLYDTTLGPVCNDCAEGMRDGKEIFAKIGVSGIYNGPCGDNEKQP